MLSCAGGITYMLSCCKSVTLLLHFMTHTMSRAMQCGAMGPEVFGDTKIKGSHETKLLGLRTHACWRAELAVAETASSGSEADAKNT